MFSLMIDEEYKSSSLVNESLNNSSLLLDESIDITPVKKVTCCLSLSNS